MGDQGWETTGWETRDGPQGDHKSPRSHGGPRETTGDYCKKHVFITFGTVNENMSKKHRYYIAFRFMNNDCCWGRTEKNLTHKKMLYTQSDKKDTGLQMLDPAEHSLER